MRTLIASSLLASSLFVCVASTVALAGPDAAGPPPAPTAKPSNAPPEGIDRVSIQAGIEKVKPKVLACGDKIKVTGTIKLKVVVGANGRVSTATVMSGDAKLGACVAGVVKTAAFKKTATGGTFSYPFVFGSPSSTATTEPTEPPAPEPIKITPKKHKVKDIIQPVKIEKQGEGGDAIPEDPNGAPPPPPPPPATSLDRATISAGIAKVKTQISACGTNTKVKGTVKISVTVAPAGTVTKATVSASPDAALGACVQGVISKATFGKTDNGGSFSYPFVF